MTDLKLFNKNAGVKMPDLFYRVTEHVTTIQDGQSYNHDTDFKNKDLLIAKKQATDFYYERLNGSKKGNATFHLPFAGTEEFKLDANAAYSIGLSLVEDYGDDNEFTLEWSLIGYNSPEEADEALEVEQQWLKELGYA